MSAGEEPSSEQVRCRHCGNLGTAGPDHTCSCPHRDEDCPDHPSAAVAGGGPPAASPASKAFAFAALEAIIAGDWDRYLLRLRGAIEQRRKTPEYEAHIVAGGTHD